MTEKRTVTIYRHGTGSLSAGESKVSLPGLPWETGHHIHDPRRESAPRSRTYMVGVGETQAEKNIHTIRAAHRMHRQGVSA
ncbi:hypothetical protein [Paracoccus laeviglucosivorans]|uniref:Uncharacterized protein n=1 Tax=Paracoccus laeviglucosivorans TaxID=1197861 RepID=A0A521CWU6_9RHOB|nr:hypothetical protein [Paracoccus laeviglucosivorans]SMO63903.1 hypothetical protein SAMN06265221_105221 [Paracoccus laeviglucosivorans]